MYIFWVEKFEKEECPECKEQKYLPNIICIGNTDVRLCDKCFNEFKKKISK